MHTMIAQGSARIQHGVGKRREPTGNNGQSAAPPGSDDRLQPARMGEAPPQTQAADQRRCRLPRYLSSWRAITMRWIWFVPS